jgi:hypothetical protein
LSIYKIKYHYFPGAEVNTDDGLNVKLEVGVKNCITPAPLKLNKLKKNSKKGDNMSMNENITEKEKDRIILFHGKDIRSKKFQKIMNRKSNSSLFRIILINSAVIVSLIMIIFLLVNTIGI